MRRYLLHFFGWSAVFGVFFLFFGLHGRDHLWSIPLNGDRNWFRSTSAFSVLQLQDREIFYDGIGQSMANARQADIVMLGHSVLEFGINHELATKFQRDHGVKLFNMNMPGLASGEFLRRVIFKWDIRPKIWIINASDFPANFFFPDLTDRAVAGPSAATNVVTEFALQGHLRVVGRNLKWLIQDRLAGHLRGSVADGPSYPRSWRSAVDGNQYLDDWPKFNGQNPKIKVIRDQNCHIDEHEIQMARKYIDQIGGQVILTQVPFERWCPMRIRELADALHLPAIIAPDADFSVIDGTHMDKVGSIAFTSFFLEKLAATREFQALRELPPARTVPSALHPMEVCVANPSAEKMFVSLREPSGTTDRLVAGLATERFNATTADHICADPNPFGQQECPHPKSAAAFACR